MFGIDLGKLPDAGQIDLPDDLSTPAQRSAAPEPESKPDVRSAAPPAPKSPPRPAVDEPFGVGLSAEFDGDESEPAESPRETQPSNRAAQPTAELRDEPTFATDDLDDADDSDVVADSASRKDDDTYWDALNDWEWGEGEVASGERPAGLPEREDRHGDRGRRRDRDRGRRGERGERGGREGGRGERSHRDRDRDRPKREHREDRSDRQRASSGPPPTRPADEPAPRATYRDILDEDVSDFGAGVLDDAGPVFGAPPRDDEAKPERSAVSDRNEAGEGRGFEAERPRGEGDELRRRRRRRRGRRGRGASTERESFHEEGSAETDAVIEERESDLEFESDEPGAPLESEADETRREDVRPVDGREGGRRRRGRRGGRGRRDRYPREEVREAVPDEFAELDEPGEEPTPVLADESDALEPDTESDDADDSEPLTVPNYSNIPTWADAISYLLHPRQTEGHGAPSARPATDQGGQPTGNGGSESDESRRPRRHRRRRR